MQQTPPSKQFHFRDPNRTRRPKRPIYWSALGLVLASTTVAGLAIVEWKPTEAMAVVNLVGALWVAMARGFFGSDEGNAAFKHPTDGDVQ